MIPLSVTYILLVTNDIVRDARNTKEHRMCSCSKGKDISERDWQMNCTGIMAVLSLL